VVWRNPLPFSVPLHRLAGVSPYFGGPRRCV